MTINGNILTPDEGKKLTNGSVYSLRVYLGTNDSASNWWEVDANAQEETEEEQMQNALEERVSMLEASQSVARIAFVTLAEAGQIDDTIAVDHADVFDPWEAGVIYSAGDLRSYGNDFSLALYRCIQGHTSQEDWTPDKAASLWVCIADPAEEWPEWRQPIGAHDAYAMGDKVSHAGKCWVSSADGNVWEPGVFGWEEVVNGED